MLFHFTECQLSHLYKNCRFLSKQNTNDISNENSHFIISCNNQRQSNCISLSSWYMDKCNTHYTVANWQMLMKKYTVYIMQ